MHCKKAAQLHHIFRILSTIADLGLRGMSELIHFLRQLLHLDLRPGQQLWVALQLQKSVVLLTG